MLYNNDKRKFVEFRVKNITKKYNNEFEYKLDDNLYLYFLSHIDVDKYNNMRDLNKKIKRVFVDYVSNLRPKNDVKVTTSSLGSKVMRKLANILSE